ncbi:hypothetical protein [Halobacterium jilantaiense]|uniref:Uncharacterized protein n=1 Tax=Halobacterium jilantaiense TaxID=355548 RepID=A0A1I0PPI6_9EURY|nr:hypothetical protein [Halobacterium jilantaiense]SEW16324.1 hypothetical protein SAMN04487945_1849 [Halobacterium jilantaiense]
MQHRRGRRLVAAAVVVVAAAAILVAARAQSPPGAVPDIWPYPVTVLAAVALATAGHVAVTGRLRPTTVSATTAIALAAVVATAPTFDYTWDSQSAVYFVFGLGALPAAAGAALKRQESSLTRALVATALVTAVVAAVVNGSWSLPEFVGIHLAASLPVAALGFAFTVREP